MGDPLDDNSVAGETVEQSSVEVEPRRLPTQARSRKRFDAMLDAFGALVGASGFEAVTTHLVAKRAGVPVGTVYQFFPNKYALATAFSRRFAENVESFLEQMLEDVDGSEPLDSVLDTLLEQVSGMLFHNDTIARLWAVTQFRPELDAMRKESDALSFKLCAGLIRPYLSHLPEHEVDAIAKTVSRATYALIYAAGQEAPNQRQRSMHELKRLVTAYVQAVAGAPG